jgi:hypothetical protein
MIYREIAFFEGQFSLTIHMRPAGMMYFSKFSVNVVIFWHLFVLARLPNQSTLLSCWATVMIGGWTDSEVFPLFLISLCISRYFLLLSYAMY